MESIEFKNELPSVEEIDVRFKNGDDEEALIMAKSLFAKLSRTITDIESAIEDSMSKLDWKEQLIALQNERDALIRVVENNKQEIKFDD